MMTTLIVKAPRALEVRNRLRFKEHFRDTVDAGERQFVIDFSRTEYIDSTGLGALVGISKLIRLAGDTLDLYGLGQDLVDLFALTKLDTLFTILNQLPSGLSARGPRPNRRIFLMKRWSGANGEPSSISTRIRTRRSVSFTPRIKRRKVHSRSC